MQGSSSQSNAENKLFVGGAEGPASRLCADAAVSPALPCAPPIGTAPLCSAVPLRAQAAHRCAVRRISDGCAAPDTALPHAPARVSRRLTSMLLLPGAQFPAPGALG